MQKAVAYALYTVAAVGFLYLFYVHFREGSHAPPPAGVKVIPFAP